MATAAQLAKTKKNHRDPKFTSRVNQRCELCGRPRGVFRMFKMCRICLKEQFNKGNIPGMTRSSW